MKTAYSRRGLTSIVVLGMLFVAAPVHAEIVTLMNFFGGWKDVHIEFEQGEFTDQGIAVAISPDGRHVYTARNGSFSISVFERDSAAGSLTFLADTANSFAGPLCESAYACTTTFGSQQAIALSPDGRQLYACLADEQRIILYDRDTTTGLLTEGPNYPSAGGFCGLSVSSDGSEVYSIANGTIQIMSREALSGALTVQQYVNTDASLHFLLAVAASPDGQNLYVASRDGEAVGVLTRDSGTGEFAVTQVIDDGFQRPGSSNEAPTSVLVSPDGAQVYVAVRVGYNTSPVLGGSLVAFNRAPDTGSLTLLDVVTDDETEGHALWNPEMLLASADGTRVIAHDKYGVAVFARDGGTGELTFRDRDDSTCSWAGGFAGMAISNDATDVYIHAAAGGVRATRLYWYKIQDQSVSCPAEPLASCAEASGSTFVIRNGEDVKTDKVQWDWKGTEAAASADFGFGDFATCTYTDTGSETQLVYETSAPGQCWIPTSHGWVFGPPPDSGDVTGQARVSSARLKTSRTAKGAKRKIQILAKRATAQPPELPLPAATTTKVQFVAGGGRCWEASYTTSDVLQNNSARFKARRRAPR